MRSILLIGVVCLLVLLPAAPAGADVDWTLNLRGRYESNDAVSANPSRDEDFDFSHLRARLGVDVKGQRWSFHGVLQGAASFDLPDNGSFGIGPVYFNANGGDSDPSDFGVVELSVSFKTPGFTATLGRQKWSDGVEVLTGVPYLDGVKKKRMAERLIGNWDWVNVGRRYDGLSLGIVRDSVHVALFGFEPLQGGVNYNQAFESFDDLEIYGATVTGRYDKLLKKAEWRLFGIQYDDERPAAFAATGGALEITTLGASFLIGGEKGDVLLWYAQQSGDYGVADQDAQAYIVEAGRVFLTGELKLSGRAGIAEASGDDTPGGDHETFFNLVPTNHKWYGAIDYSAFSNLRDIYLDVSLARGKFSAGVGLHRFELPEKDDAWYGGSGPFNNGVLGYAARRPAGGRFTDDTIGHELDVNVGWKFNKQLSLGGGVSFFDGGDAASQFLTVEDDAVWSWLQLVWKR